MDVLLYAQPVNFCDRSAETGLIFWGGGSVFVSISFLWL